MIHEAILADGPANGQSYTLPGPAPDLFIAEPHRLRLWDLEADAANDPVGYTKHRYVAVRTVTHYRHAGEERIT